MTKAVEKKTKQVQAEERLKKQFERKVKALMGRKIPNCGPIKEKELKAKAEIKRLQALNKKIRSDCERAKKAASERYAKLQKKYAAAQAMIKKLKVALAAAKQEIQKQITLKKSWMAKYKSQAEKTKKAEAKVRVLTQKLKVVTAKYAKLKSTMKHINTVSVTQPNLSH